MKSVIKTISTLFSIVLLAAIMIPALAALMLSNASVQNFAVDRIAGFLGRRAGTVITVDRVDIRFFNRVALKGIYVEDLKGDTLLWVNSLDADLHGYGFANRMLRFGEIDIEGARFSAVQDSTLSHIFGRFKGERKGRGLQIRASGVKLSNADIRLKNIALSGVDADLRRISLGRDGMEAAIDRIAMREKQLSARRMKVSSSGAVFEDLYFADGYSDIKASAAAYDLGDSISVHLDGAVFDTRTFPTLKIVPLAVTVTGTVEGALSDLGFDLTDVAVKDSRMALTGRVAGIPDIENARFRLEIPALSTTTADLKEITGMSLEKYLPGLKDITLNGEFEGTPSDLTASGSVSSVRGGVDFNIRLKDAEDVQGSISADSLDAGALLTIGDLGRVSFAVDVEGAVGEELRVGGEFSRLQYHGYDYHGISIDGLVGARSGEGRIRSADPNVDFDLEGSFDFSGPRPRYDMDLDLAHADLKALGLNTRDSSALISGRLRATASGSTLKERTGEGRISDLVYRFNADTLRSGEISLFADNLSDNKRAGFYSDFADVEIRSRLNLYDILPYLRASLHKYIPAISVDTVRMKELRTRLVSPANSPDNYYIITGEVKQTNKLAGAVTSGINITQGTKLSFMFNPAEDDFSLQLNSDYLQLKSLYFAGLDLTAQARNDSVSLYMASSEVEAAGVYAEDLSVIGRIGDDRAELGIGFENRERGLSALINTSSLLALDPLSSTPRIETRMGASTINFGERSWRISSPRITFIPREKVLEVENFRVFDSGQELTVNGRVSADMADTLHFGLNDFDMNLLSGLVARQGYELQGRMNGSAELAGVAGGRAFFSTIALSGVSVNGVALPEGTFSARRNGGDDEISMTLRTEKGAPVVWGGFSPGDKKYSFTAAIPDINLALLQPLIGSSLRDVGGRADSDITLTSVDGRPSIDGTFDVKEFYATVDYTNVRYSLTPNTVMRVNRSNFSIQDADLHDETGGKARVDEFTLASDYLRNFRLSLKVAPEKILALNTTRTDNESFYGRVFASGNVAVTSGNKRVDINIAARTEDNSAFHMPIAGGVSAIDPDFITFTATPALTDTSGQGTRRLISGAVSGRRRDPASIRSDVDIRLEVNVLPNTAVRFDPAPGSTLRGNGTGILSMHIKPREDLFSIIGDYRINEGSYEFTSSYLPADKRFSIERGSLVRWAGNPSDAYIDVEATYRIRTSIAPLVGNDGRFNQNVPVDCKVFLSDRLLQPSITFDVEVPTADAEIQSIVRNAMSTQEMKSTQFLYLLATNRFYAENVAGATSNIGTAATVSTGIEFLTNRISNMISSERYRFDLGYRPRSDMSSDEIDFSFEQELIPDRLMVEGEANYNLRNNPNSTAFRDNRLAGDFYLTYIIGRTGNLRTSAFTRTVDRFDENQGLQEHGLGLYYSRDFDAIRELFRRRITASEEEED